ncbi:MAG TPA: hypothetical protein PLM56_07715 [Cyclobacteriaceae bacterium]|jgi:ABC-type Fe3+-siderophore transport system permease subunit|nr:hypothetical protein [Cytophagales bacterium]HMR56557.1 hypothetical protein [Cyclobacteriaceae bacterium]HRE67524.1 hypothetical protein [Cyclobacteriaceae bacterium]HRF33369.1 hypothetical protein [Cyclobacteriaceae bacterium]
MDTKQVVKQIKRLEYVSGFIGIMAPITGMMLGTDNRMTFLLILGGAGIAFQPYIFLLYKKLNKESEFIRKRFLPLLAAIFFIILLVIENQYKLIF